MAEQLAGTSLKDDREREVTVAGSRGSIEVTALSKGLRVLSAFSEQRRELRLTDLARLTSMPVPTVYRLLKTLEAAGYVDKLASGAFRPGVRVLTLGFAALQGLDIVSAASVPLQRLASQTNETVNLGVLLGGEVLYLHRIRNAALVTANIQTGSLLPAGCTSMGKVLLAFVDAKDLDERLASADLSRCQGPNAIRTPDVVVRELQRTRERGWALQNEELASGLRSVAAPVRDGSGRVVAAINVAVQASQWSVERLIETVLPALLATCQQISERWTVGLEPRAR